VHDVALDATTITNQYTMEKAELDAMIAQNLGDLDGDTMANYWEDLHGFNKNDPSDAPLDADSDGSTNAQEFARGTLPRDSDTDDDGYLDGVESNTGTFVSVSDTGTNPLLTDTDGDTLRDGVEKNTGVFVDANDTGTNPLDRDTDDDGFMDHVEIARSTNPTQAGSHPPTDPVVSLDAAGLPPGALNTWTNLGSIGGNFVAENGSGIVQTVQGVNSVNMPGPITTGPSYAGPAPSPWLFGNNSYSVEAWIHNPAAANEETIFSWGRRGANGQNASFNHGLSDDFGAMGHWGGQDLGWGPDANVKQGAWTHVVYIYDAAAGVQRCYSDGVQANTENIGPLAIDNLGANNVVLPFRIAAQTENAGTPTADFRGTLAISELRVFEFPLSEATISTNFNAGLDKYGLIDYDSDGLPTWYERQYSFLNETNANDATLDFDMDGVTNRDEYNPDFSAAKPWRTLPDVSDTDGDGISDGDEISGLGGTRSVTNPVNADTDWDGVPDAREFALGTNPLSSQDSDGDGFIEWVEVLYGSNPTNAASLPATNTPLPIVNLDATALPTGSLTTWHSSNALAYAFTAAGTGTVQFVAGTKGVTFAGSDWYNGPGMPQSMGANSSRTVEAWIFNPAVAGEETVFAWGRRGGPDGSNSAFSHGTDLAFGALQFWGAGPDVPWGLNAASIATNAVAGQWTFVTYTYDNVTGIRAAYKDGVLVNSETNAVGTVLNTHVFDPSDPGNTIPNQTPLGRTLAFRVGAQNDAAGSPSAPFASMTIAKLRAYDVALSAAQIAANFNAERAAFPGQPIIRNVSVNPANGFISFDWTPAPGRTYSVEANNSVVNPGGWSTIASNLNSGSFTNDPGGAPSRFYRLRLE
jgi:hypothetical protein